MTGTRGSTLPARRRTSTLLWLAVAVSWLAAWFVPWTSRGTLSTSSLSEGARLIRSGALASIVPSWVAWLLLAVPTSGLLVLASVTRDGGVVTSCRAVLVLAMAATFAVGWVALGQAELGRLGAGGWLTVGGVLLGTGGLGQRWWHTRYDATGRERP